MVAALVLLYPLYLIAQIVIPLTLGFLNPWEPPVAEGAPSEAVLRVLVPEGETYRVVWGQGFAQETVEGGPQDPNTGYRDHPAPDEALDGNGGIHATIYVGANDYNQVGNDELGVGAVLFVSGQYAECKGGKARVYINWRPSDGLDSGINRMICGSHRYARL